MKMPKNLCQKRKTCPSDLYFLSAHVTKMMVEVNMHRSLESMYNALYINQYVLLQCGIYWLNINHYMSTFLHLAEEPELIDQTNCLADIFFRGWLSNLHACLDIWQITTAGWQPGLDWCICSYSTQIQTKIRSQSFVNSCNLLIIVQPCQIRDCWKFHR